MKYLIALLVALGFSSASAQTVDLTTPNQITLGSSKAQKQEEPKNFQCIF